MPTSSRISDEAVRKKTGRDWKGSFALLDKAGAKKMAHKEIAQHLGSIGVPGWWAQMVTVEYERARGLREKYQQAGGYSAGASRTFAVPVDVLYKNWDDEKLRGGWLKEKLVVRRAKAGKSIRITWPDQTSVEAYFVGKGEQKSQVTVQHGKLACRQKRYGADKEILARCAGQAGKASRLGLQKLYQFCMLWIDGWQKQSRKFVHTATRSWKKCTAMTARVMTNC